MNMTKQGMKNRDQTREQTENHDERNDIELGSEFQAGNSQSQSQKKSGRQVNKKQKKDAQFNNWASLFLSTCTGIVKINSMKVLLRFLKEYNTILPLEIYL